jgi:predicted metalloprotease
VTSLKHFIAALLLVGAAIASTSIPAAAASPGYVISNFDSDILLTRKNLDRFWGDRLTHYTAPGVSWLNEKGGTATGCGNFEAVQSEHEGAFYCRRDKVIYLDYSLLQFINTDWGYDGLMAIMAHEYGHHKQNLTGSWLTGVNQELEADCFSGLAMRWMQRGFPSLNLANFLSLAEFSGDEPDAQPSHGSGRFRSGWWEFGWSAASASSCSQAFMDS